MTQHEQKQSLLPAAGAGIRLDAFFSRLGEKEKTPKEEPPSRILTFFSAAACLVAVSAAALNLLPALTEADWHGAALHLASAPFFGAAPKEISSAEDILYIKEKIRPIPLLPFPDTAEDEQAEADNPSVSPLPARYPIENADLSTADRFLLSNETAYAPDCPALLDAPLPFADFSSWRSEYGTDTPYILILHTHGTEAYAPDGARDYGPDDSFRSPDAAENVVAVGEVMAQTFRAAGIPVLHCTEMFDSLSYQDSYNRAAASIRTYLAAYPSIAVILDVHRDSIIRADLHSIRPVVETECGTAAQCMLVVGTDEKGAVHPGWRDNLNFALKIQSAMSDAVPGSCRPINLRGAAFNQGYCAGALLMEIGSCANSLDEAKRAGVIAALAIADTVTGGGCILEAKDILY